MDPTLPFTVEQLAGDLLPNPTTEQLVATGFNRLNMMTREGGAQPKEYLAKYAADRVRTVSTTWLGSTMGCCQCHDHKFDPYLLKDFYRFAAFFADVKEGAVGRREAGIPVPTEEQCHRVDAGKSDPVGQQPQIPRQLGERQELPFFSTYIESSQE